MNWSYVSGYFDGEGCLLLGIVQDKRPEKTKGTEVDGWAIIPALSISSGDYEVLTKMEEFLNSENIKTNKMQLKKARKNQTKDFMRLNVSGWKNISQCIQKMLPYSIAKKEQLELYLTLADIICLKGRKWTKELFMNAMEDIDEINNLKSRQRGKMNANFFKDLWNCERREYAIG